MRKMNKIVALSLVLAMALSMLASAASFKDQATINADLVDEINLLVALGVYSEQGTGAGNFEPNGTITRAQAAKIIYVLKNKGVDNGATSWTGLNIFNDVEAGAWYEGYVNYCASVGILAGVGDNNFAPNSQLTGIELAKMLLVVIGYKADVEGYTGAKWDANILADAEAAGIFAEYELPVRGIITREWSAKMIVNALNATKVRYSDGELVEMYNNETNEPITYAEQDLGIVKTVGTLIATPNVALNTGAINEEGTNKTSTIYNGANITFTYTANESLIGQKVTVLSKGALNSTAKVYGVVAHEDVTVAETTVDAISVSKEDATTLKVKVNGVEKKIPASTTLNVYVDFAGKTTSVWGTIERDGSLTKATLFNGSKAGDNDGRAVKLIDNDDDGIYDVAMMGSVVYGEVTYYNPANNTIRANNGALTVTAKADYEKLVFVDTVAKGDIVKVTKDLTSGVEKKVIEKLDVVTGAISKVTDKTTATIDGTNYKLSAHEIIADVTYGDSAFSFVTDTKAQDYFVDGKYIVYTAAVAGSDIGQTNVALVINHGTEEATWNSSEKKMVDILKNDGERVTLQYKDEVSGALTFAEVSNASTGKKGEVVEYVMDGGKVYFKELVDSAKTDITSATGYKFDKSEMELVKTDAPTLIVNDETYFFVKDTTTSTTKYAVMTAAEIKGDMFAANYTSMAVNDDGLPYVRYAVLSDALPGGDESTGLAIAAGNITEERNEDNVRVYMLDVTKMDGTVVTLKNTDRTAFEGRTNKFVTFQVNTAANTDTATVLAEVASFGTTGYVADAVEAVEGNKIMLANLGYKTLAKDVKIYYIDAYKSGSNDRVMVSAADAITVAADIGTSSVVLAENVLVKANADGEIATILVEVDGEALTCYTAY